MSNFQPVAAEFNQDGTLVKIWGPNSQVAFDPSSVAITGGVIGGVALSSMAPPALGGRVVGWLGDSITNGSNASNIVYSFSRQAMAMAGTLRLSYAGSVFAGVPGERSDQIAARLPAVLAQGATSVFVLAGTNDAGQSVPVATYIANMAGIIQACRRAGVPVYVSTVPPRGAAVATATTRQLTDAYNSWIRVVAPTLGATVVDVYVALVDTTTGDMLASCDSGDGIHPNNLGHRKIALAIVAKLLASGMSQAGAVQSLSAYNLVANPLMAGAGTKPTGFFEQPGGTGTAPTYSIVSDVSGFLDAGRWAEMDFDATASGGSRTLACALSATGWVVGDVIAITGKGQVEDVAGTWEGIATTSLTGAVALKVTNSGGVPISSDSFSSSTGNLASGKYDLGPSWITFAVPAGTTAMNLWGQVTLPTGAHIKARFGALGVINLTALGLTEIN